jgi:hypothetical protein
MGMDRLCACVGGLVLRARPKTRNPKPCQPFPSASTACGFGAQAFQSASAFNANIGAWNTAAVTTLENVCAAPGPGGAHYGGRARPSFGAARPVVRGGTADARTRVRTRAGTRFRGAMGVGTAARRGGSVHASEYMYRYIL